MEIRNFKKDNLRIFFKEVYKMQQSILFQKYCNKILYHRATLKFKIKRKNLDIFASSFKFGDIYNLV